MNAASSRITPVLAAAALALVVLSPGLAMGGVATGSSPSAPTGNAQGVALLARVERAYQSVPGVRIRFAPLTAHLVLRSGKVVAEEANLGAGGTFVARSADVTYAYTPSKKCWQRSAGVKLELIGLRFPLSYRTIGVQAPKQVSGGWTLRMTTASAQGVRSNVTFRIAGPSHLLRSTTVSSGGSTSVEQVTELPVEPKIPAARPLC